MQFIYSNQNEKFKYVKKLKQKKYRIIEKKIILEGKRIINHTISLGISPDLICYEGSRDNFNQIELIRDFEDIVLEKALFNQVSETVNSQGILAVFDLEKIKKNTKTSSEHIVVLNGVQDPGNMGTIIRTCDALSYDRIILSKNSCDPYSQKALRSCMASIFSVSLTIGMENSDIIAYLKKNDYKIYASSLEADCNIENISLDKKSAIIFGNEGNGIDRDILDSADVLYKIPMREGAESFNVGVASAISLYVLKNNL